MNHLCRPLPTAVRIEKEVAADSKEAQAFFRSQQQPEKTQPISLTSSAPAAVPSVPTKAKAGAAPLTKGILAG